MFDFLVQWMFTPNTYNDMIVYLSLAFLAMLGALVFMKDSSK